MPTRILHLRLVPRETIFLFRPRSAAAGMLLLAFGSVSAHAAEPPSSLLDRGMDMFGVGTCFGTVGNAPTGFTRAADCAVGQVFSALSDVALGMVEEYGKARFGEHFQIDRRLGLVASTGALSAELDIVVPLAAFSSSAEDATVRSFFVQNGVTRWRDAHGHQRNDLRLGVVHRHRLSEQADAGILGATMFMQENMEFGHQRVVTGFEYIDRRGRGAIFHYQPVTNWRPGRLGYEERAIAGWEFSYGTELTGTLGLDAAAGRWEARDGSGAWTNRGRLGVSWRPHRWFEFRGDWDEIGTAEAFQAARVAVTIPLGGGSWPVWRGLGRDDPAPPGPGQGVLWAAAGTLGTIDVIEQAVPSSDGSIPDQDPASETTVQTRAVVYRPPANAE